MPHIIFMEDNFLDSFMARIGGKKLLRDVIISRFPSDPAERYIEVFGGAGWVLFRKEKYPAQLEVFNDLDNHVVNLFRCIKHHREALQKELEWLPSARIFFNECLQMVDLSGLTDIQKAARFLYLIKISFGADARTFKTFKSSLSKTIAFLEIIQERLDGVVIECKDFENLISVYDRPDALFYLDPPYVGTEQLYAVPFNRDDHLRLCNRLKSIKGRFVLSYNDCDFIRDLYSQFYIENIVRRSTLSAKGNNQSPFHEVIIRNYN